jgi:hypothetical protein
VHFDVDAFERSLTGRSDMLDVEDFADAVASLSMPEFVTLRKQCVFDDEEKTLDLAREVGLVRLQKRLDAEIAAREKIELKRIGKAIADSYTYTQECGVEGCEWAHTGDEEENVAAWDAHMAEHGFTKNADGSWHTEDA